MNNKISYRVAALMMAFVIILTGAFTVEASTKIKLNKTKATITVGKTLQLKVTGTTKKVKWSSNKKAVATVTSKGKVTAKKAGTATITAKISAKKLTCKITVKAKEEAEIIESGSYTSKDDVALYIYKFGHLPDNFITKKEASALGWSGGSLEPYAPGKCIGGDYYSNYEGTLPAKEGRSYTECDIDTLGASSRGAKRIVFSNDGLIYYTADHYATFTLLYGTES